jgi:hypothetical protein
MTKKRVADVSEVLGDHRKAPVKDTPAAPRVRTEAGSEPGKAPLDETRVEFDDDQIDQTLSDAHDDARLSDRRATQDKYE